MPSPVARYALDNGFPRDLIFTPERAGEVYALWQKFYAILDGTFSLSVHCVLCFTLKGFNKYWFFLKKIVWFFIIVIICHSLYMSLATSLWTPWFTQLVSCHCQEQSMTYTHGFFLMHPNHFSNLSLCIVAWNRIKEISGEESQFIRSKL